MQNFKLILQEEDENQFKQKTNHTKMRGKVLKGATNKGK